MTIIPDINEIEITPNIIEIEITPIVNEIEIAPNTIVSIEQNAEWGEITGDIANQSDLQLALSALQSAIENISLAWGNISGLIDDQVDLKALLDAKAAILDLANVAFSGDYGDLTNKPTIINDHTQLNNIGTNSHADIDLALTRLANTSGTNTGDQDLSGKQDLLVSGTNIKTVNNETLLGSGNITTGNSLGTIGTNQIAFGSGINTISGASDFTYSANRLNVREINITNALFSGGYRFLSENRTLFSTAIGYQSLLNNTAGSANTAIGHTSLLSNTTGSWNTAIGRTSLLSNTTGSKNIAVGHQTLHLNITGNNNTAIGFQSAANTTGSDNTAIGYQSLLNNTAGNSNIAIGGNANTVGNLSNTITIGVNVNPIAANTVTIGTTTHTNTYLYGTLNQLSTAATRPVAIFKTAFNQSTNILEIRDFANVLLTNFSSNGAFQPVVLTDANAPNSSLYYSSTQSRFVYKDSSGNYNNLIQTGNITTQITAINDVIEYNGNSNINLTANPQIVVGTNGRRIIIVNSSTNTVTINNGNGVRLNNGLSFTFNQGDTMQLVYSTSLSAWLEVARSENS